MVAKAWACAASTAVTSNCTMAAVSQQQEELAPGLLHKLAVVSETLETTTREVKAEGRPTREATQLAKEKAGVPSEFTPHSSTSAATNSHPYEGLGATAGAMTGATADVTTIGSGGGGEDARGGGGLAVGGGGGCLPDTLSSATLGVTVGVATGLVTAREAVGVAVGEAVTAGVVTGTVTAGVGAAVTAGVATGVAAGVSTGE